MLTYHWLRVRAPERSWNDAYGRFSENELPGAEIWGAFYGLFGLGSNELMLVIHADGAAPLRELTAAGFEVVDSRAFVSTVRPPKGSSPRPTPSTQPA